MPQTPPRAPVGCSPRCWVTFAELIHSFSPSLKKKNTRTGFNSRYIIGFLTPSTALFAENCDKMSQHDKNNPKAAEASCRPPGWSPEGSDCCGFAGSQASELPWQSQIHRPHPAQHPAAGMERATRAALPRPTAGEALSTTKKLSCRGLKDRDASEKVLRSIWRRSSSHGKHRRQLLKQRGASARAAAHGAEQGTRS